MNNAISVAWRAPWVRPRSAIIPPSGPSFLLRLFSSATRNGQYSWNNYPRVHEPPSKRFQANTSGRHWEQTQFRPARIPSRSFRTSTARLQEPNSSRQPPSDGKGSTGNLTVDEITEIFGTSQVPAPIGKKALLLLQEQRVNGTLDLDLPEDVIAAVPQAALGNALEWLRQHQPMDEDAAIMKRIEREEKEEEENLVRRAEELGLYKPQSGKFGAEKKEDNSVHGRSMLEEMGKKNRLISEQKAEEERREWLEGEARDKERMEKQIQNSTSLEIPKEANVVEAQPRADPKSRPFLSWLQQKHIAATNTNFESTSKLTKSRRILPSLLVALATVGLCFVYSAIYVPPTHDERRWPETPRSAATVIGLIGVNVAIYALWKVPTAWKMLNKYLISVPVYPRAMSMIGSVFSHQQLRHLGVNMAVLWIIGTQLHDEIGRGDFLALYTGAGTFASFTSLAAHVLLGRLEVTSLGASGAIAGLVAAWCMLRSDERFTFIFVPKDYQEKLSANGGNFLMAVVAIELISLVTPLKRIAALDHFAHLGGYAAGGLVGWFWKRKRDRERKEQGVWRRYFAS